MSDVAPTTEPGLKGEVTVVEPDRFARAVARRSAESRATVPTVEYTAIADVSGIGSLIEEYSLTPLLVAAAAAALSSHPRANAAYKDARYEQYGRVNIGVTLAEGESFVTPTVMDADEKSAGEIAAELAGYRQGVQRGELHPSVFAGATFTVIAPSGGDVIVASPIVPGGQAAVLTAGPVRSVPVWSDDGAVEGRVVQLGLAADHRILYGARASAFLQEVKIQLEGARA